MEGLLRKGARSVGRITVLGVALMGLAVLLEDKLIYFPIKYPDGYWEVQKIRGGEGQIVPRIEDCRFTASDGVTLHGWYCEPFRNRGGVLEPVPTQTVLLWFHGNAGNITHRYEMISMMMELPVRVFIIDYRGYGKSEGTPSEEGLYLDGRAAWNYLTSARRLAGRDIVILGKSLGAAVAVDLATRVEPAGLIVQSGFTSIPDMAGAVLPFVPRFLLRTRMDSLARMGKVQCPKLFIHSPADEVVPYRFGRRLFGAAREPKQFYEVAGAPHNETYLVGGQAYLNTLRNFVQFCASAQNSGNVR